MKKKIGLLILFLCMTVFSAANVQANPYPVGGIYGNQGEYSNCTYTVWKLVNETLGLQLPAWGNAGQWYDNAKNSGYSVGSTPAVNSIRVTSGHVAFVTAVNGNQVYVKEGGFDYGNHILQYHEGWINAYSSNLKGYIYLTAPENFGQQFDAIIQNGPFNRVACVAANGASPTWGNVVTERYQNNSRYKWRFTRNSDGSYIIKSHYNSCVLDVSNAVFASGTTLQVVRENGHIVQRWFIYKNKDGSYRIASAGNANLILTINNSTYDLMLYNTQGTSDQRFVPLAIPQHTHSWKSYKTEKATFSANGKIYYKCSCGSTATSTIYKLSKASLAYTSKTYTGKALYPSVIIKNSKGYLLKSGTDYTVSYSKNKYVGTASAQITFKGLFGGTKTLYFKINPKGTTISKLISAKKGFKVYWKRQTSQTTGYQIRYSTSSKMKSAKTINGGGSFFTSKSVSKLAARKKYYVQVRTYKIVSGKYYYSSWSPIKAVTTKK